MSQQEWLIQAAFASLAPVLDQQVVRSVRLHATTQDATVEQYLSQARAIGDRLIATALHSAEMVEWLELIEAGEQEWQVVFTDADLYNGTAGITLFLAYLGKQTGSEQYTTLARKAFETTRRKIHSHAAQIDLYGLGAFIGLSSFIYLLAQLGTLWEDDQLYVEAEYLVQQLSPIIAQETAFDVNSGTAGCLLTLLALYKVKPTQAILQASIECGEHLLKHMRSTLMGRLEH
ncbi:lanthionine synthetase LanC family protein [Dictyobacter kobayashii]|uniref:lanthionine synthetase LanC family protein n=1 Tax=Dictyobacter kobayashii TaxID=2014872 RepID=UPI0013871797|nr:lanthionine synthetase LanC family protein [Dictyobacter kobayashii]